ncbi:hypothetical protein BJV78DRAFT_1164288 [Lactifluus subvellereus]|nr:hypothetical protein BJV78DRAFT_1164288 [Lactifluus subvellereus]
MPWQALPIELTIQVLEALDPLSLVNCRRTSRLFKSLIDETTTLQYRIALYASGMVDGPPGQLSSLERLNLLRSYEASWKNVDWSEHTSIPLPGGIWELYGNVWAHGRGDNGINCIQLPSRLRGISMRQWTLEFDFTLRDFGMDPSQDLLVTIEMRHPQPCQIGLHTLSTGEKHPLARNIATLEYTRIVLEDAHISSYSIRVSGDYVGILFASHEDENELVVWNWKTGARCLVIPSADMLSFTFLGHKFVLASTLKPPHLVYRQPALLLYSLDQRLVRNKDHADTHLLCFLFRSYWSHSIIHLTSDPSPEWSPSPRLQVPFQIAGDDQIVALHRQHNWASFRGETFLMPASTLLEHVKDTPIEGEGRDIEWESWGPRCCNEYVPSHGRWTVWPCFVFGMRYVFPRIQLLDDRPVMVVRDLCPRRYMRATKEEREESNALQRVLRWGGPSRSIVKCVPLPPGIRTPSGVHFMISEDGIVALEVGHRKDCVFMAARLMPLGL